MRMCGWEERCLFQGINGECTYGEASVRCKHERSDLIKFKVGDEVTISGTVIEIKDGMCGQQAVVCIEEGRAWSPTGTESQMSGVINVLY